MYTIRKSGNLYRVLTGLIVLLVGLCKQVNSDNEADINSGSVENFVYKQFTKKDNGTIWPGGIVKYKVNDNFSADEKNQLQLAIEDFHNKTCVHFQLWTEGDGENYVEIKPVNWTHNIFPCHLSRRCMHPNRTRQVAWFGQNCRRKENFIHELSHVLCLTHGNDNETAKEKYIFDDGGLSRADARTINKLYDCKCHRHRWTPISGLSLLDKKNMHSFGLIDRNRQKIFPCRALIKESVQLGAFDYRGGACRIWFGNLNIVSEAFEVLIIPGGFSAYTNDELGNKYRYQYEIVDKRFLSTKMQQDGTVIVSVGRNGEKDINRFLAIGSYSDKGPEGVPLKVDAFGITQIHRTYLNGTARFVGVNSRILNNSFKVLMCQRLKLTV